MIQGRRTIDNVEVLGLLEFENTAVGYLALDALVKAAPVEILWVVTVNPGKLLVFFTGDVASVEVAVAEGERVASSGLINRLFLPWAHEKLVHALASAGEGDRSVPAEGWSVAIVDISSIAVGVECADRAVKETAVAIHAVRFDDAMGGRITLRFVGDLFEIEAAVAVVVEGAAEALVHHAIIANPHPDMLTSLDNKGGIP